MVGWAAFEMLKKTTSYLLSPAYFASDLFWTSLGYGPSSRQLITTVQRQQSLMGSTGVSARRGRGPLLPAEELAGGGSVAVVETPAPQNVEMDEIGTALETSSRTLRPLDSVDDSSAMDSSSDDDPVSTLPGTSSSPSSVEYRDNPSVEISRNSADSVPPSSSESTTTDRPLSTLLSLFSHRATVCLSSLELLPDDVSSLADYALEPTPRQIQEVERRMATEVEVLEAAIEKAVEERGVASSVEVDKGRTFFEGMGMSFVHVPVTEDGIDTPAFLLALESLLRFFELFAPAAAKLASADIEEDIRRIRSHYLTAPNECRTLQLLVEHEQPQRRKLATVSLMWCFRGLKFTALAIRYNLDNPAEELSESFARSWDVEYSSYFSWVVRPLFKLLVRACPPRDQFYEKLGSPRSKVEKDLSEYLTAIEGQVAVLERFYAQGKHYM